MLRIYRLAMTLSVLSIVACAQEDPLAWFPLQVGSRWVYETEGKSGDRNRPDVDRWTMEVTITGQVTIPEGTMVLQEGKRQGRATSQAAPTRVIDPTGQVREAQPRDYTRSAPIPPYLVRNNCIYAIDSGWDGQKQELRPQYRKWLNNGELSPDFCFPLLPGRDWGNRDIPWRVEPAREGLDSLVPAQYAGAIHIFSDHYGSGGWKDVWFQKGVGVVASHFIHNGTYDEGTSKLVSFLP